MANIESRGPHNLEKAKNWGGGGDFVPTMPGCVCPKVKDMGLFQFQGSAMSDNISFKLGVKFAASLNMGKNSS